MGHVDSRRVPAEETRGRTFLSTRIGIPALYRSCAGEVGVKAQGVDSGPTEQAVQEVMLGRDCTPTSKAGRCNSCGLRGRSRRHNSQGGSVVPLDSIDLGASQVYAEGSKICSDARTNSTPTSTLAERG